MPQNTVQSTNQLYPEDQIVYVADYSTGLVVDSLASLTGASWSNIGALAEFSREAKIETQQPPSMNVEHAQQISKMSETLNLTIQELNQAVYNKLMGNTAQAVTVAGSSTNATDTYSSNTVNFDKLYLFNNQNWSSTSSTLPVTPASIVLYGSSTYVIAKDYDIIKDQNGQFGFVVFSTGGGTTASTYVLTYTFAPKAQSILYHGDADSLSPFMMKVYSIYSDGRTLTTYYPRVEYISGGAINDKAGNSGEFKDMKFSLEAREHDSYTYQSRNIYKIEVQTTA